MSYPHLSLYESVKHSFDSDMMVEISYRAWEEYTSETFPKKKHVRAQYLACPSEVDKEGVSTIVDREMRDVEEFEEPITPTWVGKFMSKAQQLYKQKNPGVRGEPLKRSSSSSITWRYKRMLEGAEGDEAPEGLLTEFESLLVDNDRISYEEAVSGEEELHVT